MDDVLVMHILAIFLIIMIGGSILIFGGISSLRNELQNGAEFKILNQMINSGEWVYSSNQLKGELGSYAFRTWLERNRFIFILFVLLCLPMGLFAILLFALHVIQANKYEEHLVMLKKSKTVDRSGSPSLEIDRLFALKQKGIISEGEFKEMKEKIVKR